MKYDLAGRGERQLGAEESSEDQSVRQQQNRDVGPVRAKPAEESLELTSHEAEN